MLLYKLPREIDFAYVKQRYFSEYRLASPIRKIQLAYWFHLSECLHAGGKLCPTFKSFLSIVEEKDLILAIHTWIITVEEVGTIEDAVQEVKRYYRKPTILPVIGKEEV